MEMKKKKMKKQKKKENRIKKFFSSYNPILITLIILIIVLLGYCNYLLKSTKLYTFNASSDYITIYNGVVSLNYDMNLLEGSDITYNLEKDIIVTKYKIGYYVKDGDNLVPICVALDEDEEGFSLKGLIESSSSYNITELAKNNNHFSKNTIKLLDKGLFFVIEATDTDNNIITDVLEMNMTKLTK